MTAVIACEKNPQLLVCVSMEKCKFVTIKRVQTFTKTLDNPLVDVAAPAETKWVFAF